MKEFLIVTIVIICALPLALIGRLVWRWLRRDNLVAELTEETIRLSDLAGGLRNVAAEKEDFQHRYSCALDNWETAKRRIDELEAASRTDHATIGDLHDQIKKLKRDLANSRRQATKYRNLAQPPTPKKYNAIIDGKIVGKGVEAAVKVPAKVTPPARKRGGK